MMWEWKVLVGVATLFFALTATLAVALDRYPPSSPDEAAARTFMRRIVQGKPLGIVEPLNAELERILHPRSTTVIGATIVPQGFPTQMALWGMLTRVTHIPLALWTPLFGALALPLLFVLFQLFLERRVALVATLFAFAHPAILYYTIRGFYPNAAQVFLLIAAMAFGTFGRRWSYVASGIFLALAIALRPSEVIWIVPFVLICAWWGRARFTRKDLAALLIGAIIAFIPVLLLHIDVYGSTLVGYALPNGREEGTLAVGFSVARTVRHMWQYLIALFWWWTPFVAIGISHIIRNSQWVRQAHHGFAIRNSSIRDEDCTLRRYSLLVGFIALIVIGMYGSWDIQDSVSAASSTIGTSFVRYWLIVFLLMLPFAALGFQRIRSPVGVLAFVMVVSVLYPTVFGFESVTQTLQYGKEATALVEKAQGQIPSDAVILVERTDKIFWPSWRVIVGSPERAKVLRLLPSVVGRVPLYYHRVHDLEFASPWDEVHLRRVGLTFDNAIVLDSDNALVPIIARTTL